MSLLCIYSADEFSYVVAHANQLPMSGSNSPAHLGRFDSAAYSFRSVSSGTSGSLSRATSVPAGATREISLAVLLRRLPTSVVAFVDRCVARLADSRHRRQSNTEGMPTGAVKMDLKSPRMDKIVENELEMGSQLTLETTQESAVVNTSAVAAVPTEVANVVSEAPAATVSAAKALLREKTGFAGLASEILSSVFTELMQDTLTAQDTV
jgi:hypothetical protein